MKKSVLIWGLALVLIIVALIVTSKPPAVQNPSASNPSATAPALEKASDFTLKDLNGKTVSLSDFRGKSVYVNFFATWCPPCKGEMPDIEKMYQKYASKGLVILAVDLSEDAATVKNFIQKNGYNFKVLLDSDNRAGNQYQTNAIPVSVFIDKAGNIVSRIVGALTLEDMEKNISIIF